MVSFRKCVDGPRSPPPLPSPAGAGPFVFVQSRYRLVSRRHSSGTALEPGMLWFIAAPLVRPEPAGSSAAQGRRIRPPDSFSRLR